MCVRKISAQCVLQFTPSLAAGCVLHRPVSRVIHCSELYFFLLGRIGISPSPCVRIELSGRSPLVRRGKTGGYNIKLRRVGTRAGTGLLRTASRSTADFRGGNPPTRDPSSSLASLSSRETPPIAGLKRRGTGTPYVPRMRSNGRSPREGGNEDLSPCGESPSLITPSSLRREPTVMILPQVHLRKPCYDFYFL